MVKKLQIKTENGWKYVFCRNMDKNKVITTENRKQALEGQKALEYFKLHFANDIFRLE